MSASVISALDRIRGRGGHAFVPALNVALRRQVFQLQYYTEDNIPEAIVSTPAWTVDQGRSGT
ncbi:MAG: hypothetical protein ACREFQ_05190 [Stellaceae bacterium]